MNALVFERHGGSDTLRLAQLTDPMRGRVDVTG